jgi:hypothetical protein
MFGQHWNFFEIMATVATWFTGLIVFLIWLAVIVLFVRFLLIATRAAKVYLRNNGEHDGVLPRGVALPGATAPAAPAAPASTTRPAPRPRTPKP